MKIIVGAGSTAQDGWLSLQQSDLDITRPSDCLKFQGCTHILAEHVLEHIAVDQVPVAVRNMASMLAIGGRIRIAVPDGFHPDPAYQKHVAPPADGHTFLWDYVTLGAVFLNAGLCVQLLEWWDKDGVFHRAEWSPEDGFVRRSFQHDPRNKDRQPHYTSLILDARRCLDPLTPSASADIHLASSAATPSWETSRP